jgi:hypothetical protein
MTAQLIPASTMTAADNAAYMRLQDEACKDWQTCSFLPFLVDGEVGVVVVGQKRADPEDERYYVFRLYSHARGVEYHGRFAPERRADAVASRFEAAEEVADVIFDNRKK